jgi:hypothetical protein
MLSSFSFQVTSPKFSIGCEAYQTGGWMAPRFVQNGSVNRKHLCQETNPSRPVSTCHWTEKSITAVELFLSSPFQLQHAALSTAVTGTEKQPITAPDSTHLFCLAHNPIKADVSANKSRELPLTHFQWQGGMDWRWHAITLFTVSLTLPPDCPIHRFRS